MCPRDSVKDETLQRTQELELVILEVRCISMTTDHISRVLQVVRSLFHFLFGIGHVEQEFGKLHLILHRFHRGQRLRRKWQNILGYRGLNQRILMPQRVDHIHQILLAHHLQRAGDHIFGIHHHIVIAPGRINLVLFFGFPNQLGSQRPLGVPHYLQRHRHRVLAPNLWYRAGALHIETIGYCLPLIDNKLKPHHPHTCA